MPDGSRYWIFAWICYTGKSISVLVVYTLTTLHDLYSMASSHDLYSMASSQDLYSLYGLPLGYCFLFISYLI